MGHFSGVQSSCTKEIYIWQSKEGSVLFNDALNILFTVIWRRTHRLLFLNKGARCSSVVRAFAHGAMGRRIDPSWDGPIELFLVPASAPRLV